MKKILLGLILAFLMLTGAAYAVGVIVFSERFMPGTVIDGYNCAFKTPREVEQILEDRVSSYVLEIGYRGGETETISAKQAGLHCVSAGNVEELFEKQDAKKWLLELGKNHKYGENDPVRVSEKLLKTRVSSFEFIKEENQIPPTDAYIQDTINGYEIVPETEGNALDISGAYDRILSAVTAMEPWIDLEAEGFYQKPSVYRDDPVLQENIARLEKISSAIITYDFADRTERVDKTITDNWIATDADGAVYLDEAKVAAYVNGLAEKYDTFGNERVFMDHRGNMITISGGDYGWLIDRLSETQVLMDKICSGAVEVREPVYAYTAVSRDTGDDIGYTYIEVDLTEQWLVYYQDGQPIIETPVVTGFPGDTLTETPQGAYAVREMHSPYQTADNGMITDVNYMILFYGDLGICDASWRADFGGIENYSYGTSGNVDVPFDGMQALYSYAETGMPVIIHK